MPEVEFLDELNEQIRGWEIKDEARQIRVHASTIAQSRR